jgi:hypothetical protein
LDHFEYVIAAGLPMLRFPFNTYRWWHSAKANKKALWDSVRVIKWFEAGITSGFVAFDL